MPEERRREINTTALAVGGAVIAICGLGLYYIWTRQKLVDEYIYWIHEWQREYTELMETGGIPACEEVLTESECLAVTNEGGTHGCIWWNKQCISVLTWKGDMMRRLQGMIEDRGLLGWATDLVWAGTGFMIAYGVYSLLKTIMKRYFERNPRDPHTGEEPPDKSKPYKDITDSTWHPTEEDLADHYRDVHPTPGEDPEAWSDVWKDIQAFPDWFISLLAAFNLDGLEDWIKHDYRELDPAVQVAIWALIGIAIVIACVLVGAWNPGIVDKGWVILDKIDKIPTPA